MKKVYCSHDLIMAGHVHSILEANNIDCYLRNMSLTSGIGELPINECWPEVWVIDEADYKHAKDLINSTIKQLDSGEHWRCQCGENIEGQFDVCWSCGNEKNN